MADAIVNVFLEKLLSTLAEEGRYVTEFRDQFEKLQTELQLLQCFLKDADRLKRKNHTIRKILADLRELIYEAEDILADCQLQSRDENQFSQSWLACFSPPKLHFKYQSGKRLKEITEKITSIKQNISSFLGGPLLFQPEVISAQDQMPRWSSQVYDHTQVIAKDDAFYNATGTNYRHLGVDNSMDKKQLIANQKLRGLVSTTKTCEVNKIESGIAKRFSECKYLRVLDVSKSIFELPLSSLLYRVGTLQHLTYLGLSNTHPLVELPDSLENLTNLQILDVSYCQNLKFLPQYLIKFKKLKVLDVSFCGSLENLPKGLGRLSNLEVLLGFRPARSNNGCRIGELRNLTRLRTLGLHLTHADEVEDSEFNAMMNLQDLEKLSISFFDSHGSASDLTSKIDKLCPPQQLHELSVMFYPGKISPLWLNPLALPMLKYLSISSGNLAKMHQNFWGGDNNIVWKVEGLMLESLSDLELQWPKLQQLMQILRVVNVSWCPELVSFPIEDVGFRGGVWIKEQIRN
ncbi:hypothetical protein COLO4_22018 [Corchorus olitorius]|uniref:Uncharacterized protein n=1 Tax=Corchorus olitorius TaxID=93759 RepID=A0A1R3IPK5_9ROSI|nr:hypothetical protein COLO4_22018 [Corchorus olitorius]